jgi:hypothetical protein
MEDRTELRPTELSELAIDWWCPNRFAEVYGEMVSCFVQILEAYDKKDFGTWHLLMNGAACVLGYDDEWQEEAILDYLENLCRGYFDSCEQR